MERIERNFTYRETLRSFNNLSFALENIASVSLMIRALARLPHALITHFFFKFPGPPNFGLSLQGKQRPQSSARQLLQNPQWLILSLLIVFDLWTKWSDLCLCAGNAAFRLKGLDSVMLAYPAVLLIWRWGFDWNTFLFQVKKDEEGLTYFKDIRQFQDLSDLSSFD